MKQTSYDALHFAASNGHLNVCKYIVNLDEDKNPADKDGRTPLHMAAYNHNGAICEFITELAEKNPEDLYGRTSLKLWNEASEEKGKWLFE